MFKIIFKKYTILFILQIAILYYLIIWNELHNKTQPQVLINNDKLYISSIQLIEHFEGLVLDKPYPSYENKKYFYVCRGNSFAEYQKIFHTSVINLKNCNLLFNKMYYMILNDIRQSELKLKYTSQYVAIISLCYNIKKNFINFKKSKLYQLLTQETQDNEKIIVEWLDFSKVNGLIDCKLLKRNKETLIVFFKEYKEKEKENAYSILQQEYSKYNCVK